MMQSRSLSASLPASSDLIRLLLRDFGTGFKVRNFNCAVAPRVDCFLSADRGAGSSYRIAV